MKTDFLYGMNDFITDVFEGKYMCNIMWGKMVMVIAAVVIMMIGYNFAVFSMPVRDNLMTKQQGNSKEE